MPNSQESIAVTSLMMFSTSNDESLFFLKLCFESVSITREHPIAEMSVDGGAIKGITRVKGQWKEKGSRNARKCPRKLPTTFDSITDQFFSKHIPATLVI